MLAATRGRVIEVSVAGTALVALAITGVVWASISQLQELRTMEFGQMRAAPVSVQSRTAPPVRSGLPTFSSAELAKQFNQTATDVGLRSDEISYSLEASPGQPFLRYRLTFPVQSNYPTIRRFVAALSADMPHVVLDGIRCSRESTSSSALVCDLTLSAFFARGSNE